MDTSEMKDYVTKMEAEKRIVLQELCDLIGETLKTKVVSTREDNQFIQSMEGFQRDVKRISLVLSSDDDMITLVRERAYAIVDQYIDSVGGAK